MPIYEFKCGLCGEVFESLTLKVSEAVTSPCPHCGGEGKKLISRPAIVYEVFDERAIHKLPDWRQKQKQAEAHDRRVRRTLKEPLPTDRGQGIKTYNMDFGKTEKQRLESKAQLDNMG